MSQWQNWFILRLPEPTEGGVDTACGCDCHCLYLLFIFVACIRSGFEMITWATGFSMGVARLSRLLWGVGVWTMRDAELDTMGQVESVWEVPPGGGVLHLLVPITVVGEYIDHYCGVDAMDVMCWVISVTQTLFSKDKGVEFWPGMVQATELPPWDGYLLPAGMERCLLAGWNSEFSEWPHVCCFCESARLQTFSMIRAMEEWPLWKGIVQIWMFDMKNVGKLSSACICNRR